MYGYGEKVVNVLSHTDNDRKTTEEMTLMESQACWCSRENQKIRKHMSSLNETEKNKKKNHEKKKERRIFTVSEPLKSVKKMRRSYNNSNYDQRRKENI